MDEYAQDSGLSFQEVYQFAFQRFFVPLMQRLEVELGEERFIELLQHAACEVTAQEGRRSAESAPCNDLGAFTQVLRDPDRFHRHVLAYEVVQDSDAAFEIRVTGCLWARTFRQAGAADIGYAAICHPDYAACQAFNPRIRMVRTRTLMQGDECCDHRWIWE